MIGCCCSITRLDGKGAGHDGDKTGENRAGGQWRQSVKA